MAIESIFLSEIILFVRENNCEYKKKVQNQDSIFFV